MRLQAAFDIVDDELIVNVPKLLDRDLHFKFTVPSEYSPASRMPERTPEAWLSVIQEAGRSGQIRRELAEKILISLGRMPDLQPGQQAGICFSGGKDSAAITLLARMRYPKARLFAMFADTQDEWPETYTFIPVFMAWAGIEDFRHIETIGIHRLLEERMPFWPIAGRRHCTKNVKLLPMRDHLDEDGYDQVRRDGKPARYRKTHERQGTPIMITKPAPLLLSGERQMESLNRAELPVEPERDEVLMRMTVRPVIEFSIIDIWEFLFWMRAPYNPVYHWIKRVACSGCPFAADEELYTLGKRHPDMLRAWVETERRIGHPRLGGVAFGKVYRDLMLL